jgi:lysophospholipase L1-like esterase
MEYNSVKESLNVSMRKTITSLIVFAACIIGILYFNGCMPFFLKHEGENTGIIDADNPNIQYIGRVNLSNPKKVLFDWPGVYICAAFEGTSCSIRLKNHKLENYQNEYAVTIDQRAPRLLTTTDTSMVYHVAAGLPDSIPHTIMIQKRTEALAGSGEFCGFILDKGKILLSPLQRPNRRIEFIGNSITCGYGVEGETPDCHFSAETENACISYAAITARAMQADYALVAYSGRGVVRNYGDSNKTSSNTMPVLFERTCFSDSNLKWNFVSWVPQAVVLNLGTNDYSTQPFPDSMVFQNAYTQLLHRVRSLYPGVTMFCICGPMIGEPCAKYIKNVVLQEQKTGRDKDVFFIEIQKGALADADWGCDNHPNILGMNKIADILISTMKLRMNW